MVFFTLCYGCSLGQHEQHDGSHHGPEGIIGGTACICPGDCTPPDLSSLFRPGAGGAQ